MNVIRRRVLGGDGNDRALGRDAWNLLLHCSGNILHAITRTVSPAEDERRKVN